MSTVVGARTQECEGSLPLGVDEAVADLVGICKQQALEIEELRAQRERWAGNQAKKGGK